MSDRLIYIDGVGEILFKHSSRARHLGISVRPFLGARVSIPIGMSYNSAVRLVAEKKGWIIQHLKKMREFEKQQTIFNEYSGYCTKHYKLELRESDRKNISVRLSKGKINVTYPAELNTNSKEIQSAIRTGIERALKIEAKQYLPDKVKVLSAKFGFEYNKLIIQPLEDQTLTSLGLKEDSGLYARGVAALLKRLLPLMFFFVGWGCVLGSLVYRNLKPDSE